jgi:Uma2 family endonuclease
MAVAPAAPTAPHERILTIEDYLDLPLDNEVGLEQEIIRGRLVTMPRPGALHQFMMARLASLFERYIRRHRWHLVQVVVDADLLMDALNSYVSPDLMLFPPEAVPALLDLTARNRRIHIFVARPMLVVEILSPGGEERDLEDKRRDYQEAGIPHYWVFRTDARTLHEFVLDASTGEYRLLTHTGRRVRPRLFADERPSLTLDLDRLWPQGA